MPFDPGIDPSGLMPAGNSAGAQIADQITLFTTNAGCAKQAGIAPAARADQLAAMILVSGAFDMDLVDLSGDHGRFLRTVLWAHSGVMDFLATPA